VTGKQATDQLCQALTLDLPLQAGVGWRARFHGRYLPELNHVNRNGEQGKTNFSQGPDGADS
jgi:hypothetical protein